LKQLYQIRISAPHGSKIRNGNDIGFSITAWLFILCISGYFQSRGPSAQKHPEHTWSPFADLHGQEAFELAKGSPERAANVAAVLLRL